MSEAPRRTPRGEGLLNIDGLAERWGYDDVEELKRFVRTQGVPYFYLGRRNADKVRWEMARFRLQDVQRWEGDSLNVYTERKAEPPAVEPVKSILRNRGRRGANAG